MGFFKQAALMALVPAVLGLNLNLTDSSVGLDLGNNDNDQRLPESLPLEFPGSPPHYKSPPSHQCPGGTVTKTETQQGTVTYMPAPVTASTDVTETETAAPFTAVTNSTLTQTVQQDSTVTVTQDATAVSVTTTLTCISTPGVQQYILLPSTSQPGAQKRAVAATTTCTTSKASSRHHHVDPTKTVTVTVTDPACSAVTPTGISTLTTMSKHTTGSYKCKTTTVTLTAADATTVTLAPGMTTTQTCTSTVTVTPTVTSVAMVTETTTVPGTTSTVTYTASASTATVAQVEPTGIPYYYFSPLTYGTNSDNWSNLSAVVDGVSNNNNYQDSGTIRNVNTLKSSDGSSIALPDGTTPAGQHFAMVFQGYIWPIFGPGDYTLVTRDSVSDDTALAWVGDNALGNNWKYANTNYIVEYPGDAGAMYKNDGLAAFTLEANQVMPFTLFFGNHNGPAQADFFIRFNGVDYVDTTPYFVGECQPAQAFKP